MGVFEASTAAYPGYLRRVEITGTEGTVIVENDRLALGGLRTTSPDPITEDCEQNAMSSSPLVSDIQGHQRIIEDFIEAVRIKRLPVCDGREGSRSLSLAERIYAAAGKSKSGAC
jgi:predicted dehydrogenase